MYNNILDFPTEKTEISHSSAKPWFQLYDVINTYTGGLHFDCLVAHLLDIWGRLLSVVDFRKNWMERRLFSFHFRVH